MRRRARHLLFLLLLGIWTTAAVADDVGSAGALFLRFGVGARASGMGEAHTGVAKDASTVYWNPGAMSAVLGTRLLFMHNEYFQSIRLEQAALTHETDYGTLGLSFAGLYMDEMDRYEDFPSANPLGTFSAYDVSFAVAFSRYVLPNLSVGVAVKGVFENIDESTAKGYAFDAGLYHVSRLPGVRLGAVLANLGPPINFEDDDFVGEEFDLPRVFKLGASLERRFPTVRGDLLATFDVLFPVDGDAKQHIGAEFGYLRKLFLRGGFKAGYDSQGATFGVGVKYRKFDFDYALLLIS
ncbi:MAG: PorV/PorQ family protein, partial [Candidatus Krumholzibacteria bacterium]|nr:PorV/PorQ family protein [Candidatus Krumholzibacteria bacterium]